MRNKIIKLFLERSYHPQDVPARFYLAINFSLWDDNIEKKVNDLIKGELEGVKGISGSGLKTMVKEWGGLRELMIVMPSDKLLSNNQLSRVMYDNPEYLVSKGMKALRRLFNDTGNTYTSIFTKMQNYLIRNSKDPKANSIIDYNGSINQLDQYVGEIKNINDIKDLVNFIMSKQTDTYLKEKGFRWWFEVVMRGLKEMGKLYSSEVEWLVKGESLKIPKESKIYIVEPALYREAWEKSKSTNKAVLFFVQKEYVQNYERWLELVKKISSAYKVEIVKEKYVESKKSELIKREYNAK
jgi:hypothetical protein